MVWDVPGDNVGSDVDWMKQKGVVYEESVQSRNYVPHSNSFIIPSVFSFGGLDIKEIKFWYQIFHIFFELVSYSGTTLFLPLMQGCIEVSNYYTVFLSFYIL